MTPLKAGLLGVLGSVGALVIDGTAMVPLGAACMCVFVLVRITQRWTKIEETLVFMSRTMETVCKRLETLEAEHKARLCEIQHKKH